MSLLLSLTAASGGAASITGAGQIASAEAIGSPAIVLGVVAAGIATAEGVGQPAVSPGPASIAAAGITTAESFGSPAVAVAVLVTGLASAEAFGQPLVQAAAEGGHIGYYRVRRPLKRLKPDEIAPHEIGGAGRISGLCLVGAPVVEWGRLTPTARRRKDESELLLLAA